MNIFQIRACVVFVIPAFFVGGTATPLASQRAASIETQSIIEDSEIGYTLIYHPGDFIWSRKEKPPDQDSFSAVCWRGKVCGKYVNEWYSGKTEVLFWIKPPIDEYLRLWELLEASDIWKLESTDTLLMRSKTAEAGPYREWRTSGMKYSFRFRIGKKEHFIDAYYIEGLKDKRYFDVLQAINLFFGRNRVWIRNR